MKSFKQYLVNYLSLLALLHDVIVSALAWWLAFLMRFNFELPPNFTGSFLKFLPLIIVIQAVSFVMFGLYRGVWRFASIPDLQRIIKAVALSALCIAFISLFVRAQIIIPRTVIVLNPLLLILMMGGSRFAYRAWKERHLFNPMRRQGKPVIVLGAENAAVSLIKELSRDQAWQVVAVLDDEQNMIGREFSHVRVEGKIAALPMIAKKYSCQHCIIAMPSANHQQRRVAANLANQTGLEVLTVPSMSDMISGKVSVSQIRKIDVEDLLGRDVVKLDNQGLHSLIADQTILVSGAAGSIGSELCRQVLGFKPKKLICLDISEYALYLLQQEFSQKSISTNILYFVADVKNQTRIQNILSDHQPKVVLHAAAYKHVPLMEEMNVTEALINNALGTYQLAAACQLAQIEKFVLISTDKAVNPTNVMGASKRLAELICQSIQAQKLMSKNAKTQFITVRFGNVLGSSGSVIPKFRSQIAHGGPITITHPDITRYFMSIPEASQLVLQAGLMGNGGEIFVLDMGEPVKIIDLAKDMIRLSGLELEEIEIQYTGLRPGEKLYEELLADDENTLPTTHEKLRIAQARSVPPAWLGDLLRWLESIPNLTEVQIKSQLGEWVEEYQPDQKSLSEPQPMPYIGTQTLH
jgi:FlaA1/EpsC-like NDP-sugar epimerase